MIRFLARAGVIVAAGIVGAAAVGFFWSMRVLDRRF